MGQIDRATRLAILAVAGQSVAYFLTIVLARQLGVEGFEAYAVASAAFTLMVMYTPRGLEKYALRLLPALFERKDWAHARGYLRFGLRRTFATSLLLGTATFLGVTYFSNYPAATKLAITVSCLSLPAGALVHYYVEVLSANGRDIMATAIFRVAVPATVFALVGVFLYLPVELNGAIAVGCWGLAWLLMLLVIAVMVRRTTSPEVWLAEPADDRSAWRRAAHPFLTYRISLALLAQIGVIALDRLHPSATAVGAYVAAIGTANMALVMATSTNRYYARRLSILLEQADYSKVLELRRERQQWLLPAIAIFLAIVFYFGSEILGFFRPEFVIEGLTALKIFAVSTAISVLFALAPTYLKYMGRNRTTRNMVVGAAFVQIVLLITLVPRFAATGAAIAYAVSMSGMYMASSWIARNELARLKSGGAT
jgi:O-antigen/teichoic acid export membrane protein